MPAANGSTSHAAGSYEASPIARKVKNLLAIKKISYYRVEVRLVRGPRRLSLFVLTLAHQVPMILPRPDLADRLGVKYRLVPVLAIGRDVYCDSSLIADTLERRFPPSEGFGTLFPNRKGSNKADTGMIKAFAMTYADRTLGGLGSQMLPYQKFKPDFLKDRSAVCSASVVKHPAPACLPRPYIVVRQESGSRRDCR